VGVSVAPIIPGLNDSEIAPILEAAREARAQFATYSLVRLQGTVADVFTEWLERNVSAVKKETILARIRESHGGRLDDSRPGVRMTGEGKRAAQIGQLFRALSRRLGFEGGRPNGVTTQFLRQELGQLELRL
jgi:DNA repair photolyase